MISLDQPPVPSPSDDIKTTKKPSDIKAHKQTSLEREVYYVDDRREEVVTYSAPLITFGDKLGAHARKRGLSETEEEAYRTSLGSLCDLIMKSSQQSLNKKTQVISANNQQRNLSQTSLTRSIKSSTPDIEKVICLAIYCNIIALGY